MRLTERKLHKIITEEITKGEIGSMIASKLDTHLNSSDFKKKVKEISADIVSNLFKVLWQQNSMWKRVCQQ